MSRLSLLLLGVSVLATAALWGPLASGADERAVTFPPVLPGGVSFVTDTSERFLEPSAPLRDGVAIATTAPTVDFLYFPGQDYPGHPWSAWGDSLSITASAGLSRIATSLDDTVNRAELALSLAKARGRNRLELASESGSTKRYPWTPRRSRPLQ